MCNGEKSPRRRKETRKMVQKNRRRRRQVKNDSRIWIQEGGFSINFIGMQTNAEFRVLIRSNSTYLLTLVQGQWSRSLISHSSFLPIAVSNWKKKCTRKYGKSWQCFLGGEIIALRSFNSLIFPPLIVGITHFPPLVTPSNPNHHGGEHWEPCHFFTCQRN